jgi:hypothetical protein
VLYGATSSRKIVGYQIGVLTKLKLVSVFEINKYGCLGGSQLKLKNLANQLSAPKAADLCGGN